MGEVLTTRLQHGSGDQFKNYMPGEAPPDGLDDETLADLRNRGLLVDESDYQAQPEYETWAVERMPYPEVHKNQGVTPAQPGDAETDNFTDDSFPNDPVTDQPVEGRTKASSYTGDGQAAKADAAKAQASAAADQAASVSGQASTLTDPRTEPYQDPNEAAAAEGSGSGDSEGSTEGGEQ